MDVVGERQCPSRTLCATIFGDKFSFATLPATEQYLRLMSNMFSVRGSSMLCGGCYLRLAIWGPRHLRSDGVPAQA